MIKAKMVRMFADCSTIAPCKREIFELYFVVDYTMCWFSKKILSLGRDDAESKEEPKWRNTDEYKTY